MTASTASTASIGIALIAHGQMDDATADFVLEHAALVGSFPLLATGTTGQGTLDACPSLSLTLLKSGPLGGDQQIGAMIATGEVGLVIFLVDPLTAMPHDVDVKALTRLAIAYDIPMALNRATAKTLVLAID